MRKRFSKWYSKQILHALENAYEVMYVKVDVKFAIMKPLRAKCLSEFYGYINSSRDHT